MTARYQQTWSPGQRAYKRTPGPWWVRSGRISRKLEERQAARGKSCKSITRDMHLFLQGGPSQPSILVFSLGGREGRWVCGNTQKREEGIHFLPATTLPEDPLQSQTTFHFQCVISS